MKNKLAIILAGILVSGLSIGAVTKVYEPVKYEYITVVQDNFSNKLYTTTGSEKSEEVSVKNEITTKNDFKPLLRKVSELQSNGWEVTHNDFEALGAYSTNYFLLRKAK